MVVAPLPPNEAERLLALERLAVLDTPREQDYDDLAELAATTCATPIATVTLIDPSRQWFKAHFGLDACETHRDPAFCAHAILGDDLFEVPDAAADERFRDNPFVTGEPGIRFYAGMPLTTPDGFNIGTLCVIDRTPRSLTPGQRDTLRVLARQVIAQMLLRRKVAELAASEAARRASEERFQAFMDHSPALAFMKDEAGRYVYVNDPVCRRFEKPEGDWLGHTDADFWAPEITAALREVDQRVLDTGETVRVLETVPTPDQKSEFWQGYKFRFTDRDGRKYLAGMSVDVTAEKHAEDALRTSEAKFRSTIDRLAEGVFVVDAGTGRFVEANAAVLSMLGYTLDDFLALDPFAIVAGEPVEVYLRNVREMHAQLTATGRSDVGRRRLKRKDGAEYPVDIRVTVVPNGGAGLHAVIVRDVTEQVAYEERLFAYQLELEDANSRLKARATTDELTGAHNRASFNGRLADEFTRARRSALPLSLLLLDVDHFKLFNDTFGHPAGDDVLREVAQALQRTVRASDVVARYGGEEFAIILPDTDHVGALVLAERCRRAVAGLPWEKRVVTVSVGAATLTDDTPDRHTLVEDADKALYQSKQAGRNRVQHGSGSIPLRATVRA